MATLIDRIEVEPLRRVWRMRRESLLKLAESADAAAEGYAVWTDSSVVDLRTASPR